MPAGALDLRGRKDGQLGAIQRRQIVHVIVERLERAVKGVAQNHLEAAFGLAGKKRDAEIHRFLEFGRRFGQHRQATGYVKPANANLHAGRAQFACDIHGARKLIGLHAYQRDQTAPTAQLPRNALRADARIGLIESRDFDLDVVAEHAPLLAIERQPIHHRQRVRRNGGTQPLDDVAVVVVVRRLDQHQREALRGLLCGPHMHWNFCNT